MVIVFRTSNTTGQRKRLCEEEERDKRIAVWKHLLARELSWRGNDGFLLHRGPLLFTSLPRAVFLRLCDVTRQTRKTTHVLFPNHMLMSLQDQSGTWLEKLRHCMRPVALYL